MSWKRIAMIALGGGAIVAGALIPTVAVYLVPTGVGLLGYATPDKHLVKKPKE